MGAKSICLSVRIWIRLFGILVVVAVCGCSDEYVPIHTESGTFYIFSQADLDDLDGVQFVKGSLFIELPWGDDFEDPVVDLGPLSELESVTGSLRIDDIDTIDTLEPLSKLRVVGGELFLGHLGNIQTLGPLGNLSQVGNLYVQDNDRLKDLEGLQSIDFGPSGYFQIALNDSLQSLHGLESLISLMGKPGRGIEIAGNEQLVSLNGLNSLFSANELRILGNPSLSDLSALSALRIVGCLEVQQCPQISDISVFADLDTCRALYLNEVDVSDVGVTDAVVLESVALRQLPLVDLECLGGVIDLHKLSLMDMPQLAQLTGLSSLRRVEYLLIDVNPSLEDLSGLSSLESVHYVRIAGNEALCTSVVEQFVESIVVDDEAEVYRNGDC